ncbi:MAG TPA: hypothetical protein VMA32_13515, partial [Streptosporangiaceae bacterium]|nr:hypothetical protein [Streptosporangiaceae bacterium]
MTVRWHVRQIDDDSAGGRRPLTSRRHYLNGSQTARSRRRALLAGCATLLAAATLAACAGTASTGNNKPASGGKVKPGGTVTFAATQGVPPNFILPLVSADYATQTNINDFEFLLWRPLYWMGGPGT